MTNDFPIPNQPGVLEKYFNTPQGLEFIDAFKFHLQEHFLDFPGAAVAGVNKAIKNNSIGEFTMALAIDGTPLITTIIQYLIALDKKNKNNKNKNKKNKKESKILFI
jgi:hypothetical protein